MDETTETDRPADELEPADGADETATDEPTDGPDDDGHVAELRAEAAKYRVRAREAAERTDELARQLFRERVDRLELLADPGDLEYDPELLDDPDGLRAAVDELLAARPHLRTRRIRSRIGQGEGDAPDGGDLAGLLRRGA